MAPQETAKDVVAAARPRQRLGDVLVNLGFVDRETVEGLVLEARAAGRPTGQVLLEEGFLSGDQLAIAVAEHFGLQHASLEQLTPDVSAMHLVPAAALRRLDAVPVGFRDEETLVVAMVNPTNLLALDDLAMLTDLRIEPVVVSRDDLDMLLARLNRLDQELAEDEEAEEEYEPVSTEVGLEAAADDGPTIKLVRGIISQAIEQGASDVHFDPDDGDLQVRYRIDGIMADAARVPRRQAGRVISRIKILSDLDISERRLPQDGRTSLTLDGRRIDIRVTVVPLVNGESAVLRVLDPGDGPLSLGELGMSADDRDRVERALSSSHGAILATGPTGSGKSTSLYAAVSIVQSPEKTIMTIEDPVEYHLTGVKQMQVFERAGLSFSTGLRAIVRADPDVIMVGEMRDRESAKIAIEAALTGHLVLSTLHTNNAPAAPARLIDMGVEPYLVASSLDCVMAQRLARRLCLHCRKAATVPGSAAGIHPGMDAQVHEAVGCPRCRGTGYRGRVGLFEVMVVTEEIRALIVQRSAAMEIKKMAVSQGMRTLVEDGLDKVRAGETTLAEVARVTG
ncbi:MAG: type pilus assembly protein PilB [Solirubrobacteraceae bacterium]|jgi:type IV pilus assembly protein PilB|nr:type pilus assembly protein PilB [Solirubrobacteraceae bacterium]